MEVEADSSRERGEELKGTVAKRFQERERRKEKEGKRMETGWKSVLHWKQVMTTIWCLVATYRQITQTVVG